jgi:hypothetical protein
MLPYYVSRGLIALAFGILFVLTGSPWWAGVLIGGAVFAWFLWAPHSGRYAVHPELGVTALRRDERLESINDKAARNALVVVMLILGAATAYYGISGLAVVPITILKALLVLGALVYFASDFWLRRTA